MKKIWILYMVAALTLLSLTGCPKSSQVFEPPHPSDMKISRTTMQQYSFLKNHPLFNKTLIKSIYGYSSASGITYRLNAYVSQPNNSIVEFHSNSSKYSIPDVDDRPLVFAKGVYPFTIAPFPTSNSTLSTDQHLSGAIVAFNIDKTVELASFGKSEETKLFKTEIINKALSGILTEGTISFDGKPRLAYWLGNRKTPYSGGPPTAEVDFSKNDEIVAVTINNKKIEDHIGVVNVYIRSVDSRRHKGKADHKFTMEFSNGTKYKGYIRKIADNATTAFVKIPCNIPGPLLDAASNGTISRLEIYSEGENKQMIAELIFGLNI